MKPVAVRKNIQISTRTITAAKVEDSTSSKIFRLGTSTSSLKNGANRELIMRPTVVYEEEDESDLLRAKMTTEERMIDDMLFGTAKH
jgi:hypothetical protein